MKKIYIKPLTQLNLTATGEDTMQAPKPAVHSLYEPMGKEREDAEEDYQYGMERPEEWTIQHSLW